MFGEAVDVPSQISMGVEARDGEKLTRCESIEDLMLKAGIESVWQLLRDGDLPRDNQEKEMLLHIFKGGMGRESKRECRMNG